jgi:hypothetical protein
MLLNCLKKDINSRSENIEISVSFGTVGQQFHVFTAPAKYGTYSLSH